MEAKKTAVMYGAGNIGRGFIGKVFSDSGYEVCFLDIMQPLIDEMNRSLPWLSKCVNHFEVTNVGANHDLMELFTEEIDEPEPISGELYTKNRIAKA